MEEDFTGGRRRRLLRLAFDISRQSSIRGLRFAGTAHFSRSTSTTTSGAFYNERVHLNPVRFSGGGKEGLGLRGRRCVHALIVEPFVDFGRPGGRQREADKAGILVLQELCQRNAARVRVEELLQILFLKRAESTEECKFENGLELK